MATDSPPELLQENTNIHAPLLAQNGDLGYDEMKQPWIKR